MAITSENKRPIIRRYGNTQFRYAMTYVIITSIVLLILNIYCSEISHTLFSRSKRDSMTERCQLTADEISQLEVLNTDTISAAIRQMDILDNQDDIQDPQRIIVTDSSGLILYDSSALSVGQYCLFPEVVRCIQGKDVFTWQYQDGAMQSHVASPVLYFSSVIGCVYMMEYDTVQGDLILSLQNTVLRITLILEIVVLLFSVAFTSTFSRRMRRIMNSMRIIQEGDYTHKVNMGGSDELTVLGNEFNDLTDRLQTSEQKRRRFVSDASHELKTPLASIKLLSDSILQNDMDTETIRESVSDIGNEAERLNRMTAKLLSLTKIDGDIDTEAEIIYLTPTIRKVERMLSALAAQAEITVDTDLSGDAPVLILEDDLYQIIFNLMENGIKYNIAGGKLSVKLTRDEENVHLRVSDTGMGIPEDALSHIFERFYRVDKARSRQSGGSGLGLAIVKAIVLRYRGDIRVESVPDQGTAFTVSFPVFDTEVDRP